jgi:hypothetical protein
VLNSNQIRSVAIVGLLAGAMACSDSEPVLAPSEARISIADDISSSAMAPTLYASVNGVLVAIPADTVASLEVTISDVSYLAEGDDEDTESAWQTLALPAAVTLDLMALPSEQAGSIEIASGSVPVGSYRKVRLIAGEGEIVFRGPLSLGGGADFEGATVYTVTIPSGLQTGIKTDVSFEVTENEDATVNAAYLVFDPDATFLNITATGTGGVILNPVLRAK